MLPEGDHADPGAGGGRCTPGRRAPRTPPVVPGRRGHSWVSAQLDKGAAGECAHTGEHRVGGWAQLGEGTQLGKSAPGETTSG